MRKKLTSLELEVGMDYINAPRKGKYIISKIVNIEYYDTRYGKERIRIFFNNRMSKHSSIYSYHYILIPDLVEEEWEKALDDSRLATYFYNLKPYKLGSYICHCDTIVPNRQTCHNCFKLCMDNL